MAEHLPAEPEALENGLALALLGHDLRAALSEVLVGLRLVRDLGVTPDQAEPLARCSAAGEALSRLIDQAMSVCLGEADPGPTKPALTPARPFLDGIRRRWTGLAQESGHRFELTIAGPFPETLPLDVTALERILANLIGNSLHHTQACAISVTLKVSEGDLLLISVRDEGPGFPAHMIESLSRNFVVPADARRPGGGFGLQSVRQLVTALGGRVNARNPATGGAEVGICLPLAQTESVATPAPLPPPPDLTGLRVLIADDSATSRELTVALARHTGADAIAVADGAAALAQVQDSRPDVLLLDEEMPGLSGTEVLKRLRAASPQNHLPVIMVTSHVAPQKLEALKAAGADLVMQKPVLCPLELGRAILQTLDHPPTLPEFNPENLRRLKQIAGPAAAADLFHHLEEDLLEAQTGLEQAAASADKPSLRRHSHVVIALAGTAGATALHDRAVELNRLTHTDETTADMWGKALALAKGLAQLVQAVRQEAKTA